MKKTFNDKILTVILTLLAAPAQSMDRDNKFPLHRAASGNDSEEIQRLLNQRPWWQKILSWGVDPKDSCETTPLHLAALHGNAKSIQALLDAGANPTSNSKILGTPLHCAAKNRRVEALQALLPEQKVAIEAQDNQLCTPLHRAVEYGRDAHIAALVDAGADVNARSFFGGTPLHYLVENIPAIVTALIQAGADLGARDYEGMTPLLTAIQNMPSEAQGRATGVRLMLSAGADPNTRNQYGATALAIALRKERWSKMMIHALLEGGSDINAAFPEEGYPHNVKITVTPVQYAARRGGKDCTHTLLEAGASMLPEEEFSAGFRR